MAKTRDQIEMENRIAAQGNAAGIGARNQALRAAMAGTQDPAAARQAGDAAKANARVAHDAGRRLAYEQKDPAYPMGDEMQDQLDQLIAEAIDYIHGKGRDAIIEQLDNSDDTSGTMAAITYKVSKALLERHKKDRSLDITMDLAMGLATEVIDMQVEMLERMNPGLTNNTNVNRLREDALLKTTIMHGEQLEKEGGPSLKDDARVMLADFIRDGTADNAFQYVNKRANQEGLNVDDMMRKGNEMLTGKRRPIAAAVDNLRQTAAQDAPLMGPPGGNQ